MARIELNSLLSPRGITPEQEVLFTWFYSQFDFRNPGANRHIANVEPLYFQGIITGTEFLVYAATKLYLCLNCVFTNGGIVTPAVAYVYFNNQADVTFYYVQHLSALWNVTTAAINYTTNMIEIDNSYFARILVNGGYNYFKFIGYRITLD
jgi:hypothetical protein